MILVAWFTFLAAACAGGCLLADHTELGARLAKTVKGRPYIPTEEN